MLCSVHLRLKPRDCQAVRSSKLNAIEHPWTALGWTSAIDYLGMYGHCGRKTWPRLFEWSSLSCRLTAVSSAAPLLIGVRCSTCACEPFVGIACGFQIAIPRSRGVSLRFGIIFSSMQSMKSQTFNVALYYTVLQSIRPLPVIARRKEALTCNGWTPDPPPQAQTVFSVQNLAPPSGVESACNPPALRFLSLASFRSIIVAQAFIQSHPHLHHPSCPFIVAFISFQRCQNPQIIL
jgi:hypothetical protein